MHSDRPTSGKAGLLLAMHRAGWSPADLITPMSSLEIADSVARTGGRAGGAAGSP